MFPNLGYKKDTFLEPSLVSNNFPLSPNKPTITIPTLNATTLFSIAPCLPTTCNSNNHSNPLVLLALIPAVIVLSLKVLLVLSLWTQWRDRLWQGCTGYVPMKCHKLAFFTFFLPYFSPHLQSLPFKILSYQASYTHSTHFVCSLCSQINKKRVYLIP